MACATVFPSNTVISMRLPDSASIYSGEIWAVIKALEDSAAKSALGLPRVKVGVPYCNFKHCISQYNIIISTWQDDWNGAVANKLLSVKPVLRMTVFLQAVQKLSCVLPFIYHEELSSTSV